MYLHFDCKINTFAQPRGTNQDEVIFSVSGSFKKQIGQNNKLVRPSFGSVCPVWEILDAPLFWFKATLFKSIDIITTPRKVKIM